MGKEATSTHRHQSNAISKFNDGDVPTGAPSLYIRGGLFAAHETEDKPGNPSHVKLPKSSTGIRKSAEGSFISKPHLTQDPPHPSARDAGLCRDKPVERVQVSSDGAQKAKPCARGPLDPMPLSAGLRRPLPLFPPSPTLPPSPSQDKNSEVQEKWFTLGPSSPLQLGHGDADQHLLELWELSLTDLATSW